MPQFIQISPQARQTLMNEFGCCRASLWRALHFRTLGNANPAYAGIRKRAFQLGGRLMVVAPAVLTFVEYDKGILRRHLSNGAVVEADIRKGVASAYAPSGRVIAVKHNANIECLNGLQTIAATFV